MKYTKGLLTIMSVLILLNMVKSQNTFPASGNVGIGTLTPTSKLEVSGGYITLSDDATNRLHATADATGGYLQTNGSSLRFYTGSDERMRINTSGYLGIGTTSPTSKLEVTNGYITLSNDATNRLYATADADGGYLQTNGSPLRFFIGSAEQMFIKSNGYIGVGTNTPTEKLSVNGNIKVNGNVVAKKITVTASAWPDYVFEPAYKLKPLAELANFIKQYKHLPDIASSKEVQENGISVGDNQVSLLKKIEELTLYLINIDEMNKKLEKKNEELNKRIELLEIQNNN